MKLPKPGMRILKSSLAVFICFLIGFVRSGGMPFYSAIAAMLCMQRDVKSSVKAAINRTVGTFIGGASGMLVLFLFGAYPGMPGLVKCLILAACVIPLMFITVLIGRSSAAYITCVVFLSVTVSHGMDEAPWLFAVNRVIDTLIGIAVSLLVNLLPPRPDKKGKDMAPPDDILPDAPDAEEIHNAVQEPVSPPDRDVQGGAKG